MAMKTADLDNLVVRRMEVPIMDFKYDSKTGIFTCYANVKKIIDHADDRTVDGCFLDSILYHEEKGTMPKMFWMHNPNSLPVGPWLKMSEDNIGLKMEGRLSATTMGKDIKVLAEDKALDSFSIGYVVLQEKWNMELECNDLLQVHIKEVSWVNFACNEASLLLSMKSKMEEGTLPTKREIQKLLHDNGLSNRQAEKIANKYNPEFEEKTDIFDLMSKAK